MQKKTFATFFVSVHVIFVALLIHKQSYFVKMSYAKQRLEKEKQELTERKKNLTEQLHVLNNRMRIKEYAQTVLGMKKVQLKNIRTIEG